MAPPRRSDPAFLGLLQPGLTSLSSYRRTLGLRSDRSALVSLARAIGASRTWPPAAAFVVRAAPTPVLGLLAESGSLDPVHLEIQLRAAESGVGRLRYFGYAEAEAAVDRLAALLVHRFGAEALRRFRWAALPRGGLVVLGLLASRLDIPAERLAGAAPDENTDQPLVAVDDCALSGARFSAFLGGCPARQAVFAHLWSPPALRAAIAAREPRLLACLAAHDLDDARTEASERWHQRLGDRYGPGTSDRIAFPWNEPDRVVWNPQTREVELGWKLVPPELCLKQRSAAGPRIQIQPRGAGPWRPASAVLFGWHRGETIVHRLDDGRVFRLPATAHAMWWALLRGGDLAPALRLLRGRYHVAETTLEADLAGFFQTLRESGLIERSDS